MDKAAARRLGVEIATLLYQGRLESAFQRIQPVLSEGIHFYLLDEVGVALAGSHSERIQVFFEQVSRERSMGGWVVIASGLRMQLNSDLHPPLVECKRYVEVADVWYAADIFAERVPGPALLLDFQMTLREMEGWRTDGNRWLRRMVGVVAHYWSKRTRGKAKFTEVNQLLKFLEPMFSERQIDAVKGIGWGLKTLGRYYPEPVSAWLMEQVGTRRRPYRKLMLKKATTYLPADVRASLLEK